ncbi:MAG TPA: MarR family winged helix-turn-helix transcriptional regulator [Acidimicrobiales bacterium]|jgi:DNA-binding MarR family transcriptional regulator|nr:MarR family winged helix-turn-helix transcriptional regulator [Acidimicrobiales bacterium]
MAGGRARNLGGEVGSDEVGSDEPENLIDEMMAASRVFVAIVARSLAELAPDLTLPQYRVLVVLATEGSQNMNGLAAALGVTPSTASRLCERLVQRKMVSRRTSRTDRREVRLSITDHGRDLFDQVMAHRRALLGPLVAAVPESSRAELLAALRAINGKAGHGSP